MNKCILIIPDIRQFENRLKLLLKLNMNIVILDAVVAKLDVQAKETIANNTPPFIVEHSDLLDDLNMQVKNNIIEIAITDFFSSDNGLRKYVGSTYQVILLYRGDDIRIHNKPDNLYLLSV